MVAQLTIDQAGLAPGAPGVARTDGKADGSLVTLTNTGEGATTAFRLLWTPPGDVNAVGSLAATEEDPKVWTFSPTPERYGTYEVELIENAGLTSEKRERRAFVVRTPHLGLVIPACNERGDKSGSLAETGDASLVDNNAEDDPDPDLAALNWAGWWRQQHSLIMGVDALYAPVRVTHYSGEAVIRQAYGSLAAALEATYDAGTAVVDVQPNVHLVEGDPVVLAAPAEYLIRGVAGSESVLLPELTVETQLTVEACTIQSGLSGGTGGVTLRNARVGAELDVASVDARDALFFGAVEITVDGLARFDRCRFETMGLTITSVDSLGGVITLTNCTFLSAPSIVFEGGEDIGVVRMDARTKFLWDAAGGSVTNGAPIVVEAPP